MGTIPELTVTGKCPQCGGFIYAGSDHLCQFQFQPNLRDQFAMAALTGLIVADPAWHRETRKACEPLATGPSNGDSLAADAYTMADAMLEARKLKPEGK